MSTFAGALVWVWAEVGVALQRLRFVAQQAAEFTLESRGEHIWRPRLDEGFHLKRLLEGRTGNQAASA